MIDVIEEKIQRLIILLVYYFAALERVLKILRTNYTHTYIDKFSSIIHLEKMKSIWTSCATILFHFLKQACMFEIIGKFKIS